MLTRNCLLCATRHLLLHAMGRGKVSVHHSQRRNELALRVLLYAICCISTKHATFFLGNIIRYPPCMGFATCQNAIHCHGNGVQCQLQPLCISWLVIQHSLFALLRPLVVIHGEIGAAWPFHGYCAVFDLVNELDVDRARRSSVVLSLRWTNSYLHAYS